MIINRDLAAKIVGDFELLSKKIAVKAHEFLRVHPNPRKYCKYPILQPKIDCKDDDMQKIIDDIPYIKHNIPRYELKDFPSERVLYSAIFDGYNDDVIKIVGDDDFQKFYNEIVLSKELSECFFKDSKQREYIIRNIIVDIVVKYLYNVNASGDIPNNIEEVITEITKERLWRYVGDKLEIDICVPLCLLGFELDSISLSENMEIVRIPDDIQKSRKQACQYEVRNEDYLASCATHMLLLHGYHIDNDEYVSVNYTTRNYRVYPLDEIDNVLSVIRIVTGYQCGYEQVLTIPIGWFDTIFEDLRPIYGAKTPFVNPKEIEKHWMSLDINIINASQIDTIVSLYKNLTKIKSKGKCNHLIFSLKRLNRCMLRNEDDDRAIDATIGLESLLSGGNKSEITYTLSNRIGVVFSQNNDTIYKPIQCRSIMKKIYAYRSAVVHGGTLKERDKYVEIDGEKYEIENVAVDFLRQTLLFILNNPEYIDAQKIDEHIDKIISEQ